MDLSESDVLQIMKFMDESKFEELHLEMGGLKLVVNKRGAKGHAEVSEVKMKNQAETASAKEPLRPQNEVLDPPTTSVPEKEEIPGNEAHSAGVLETDGYIPIHSPMLGTFYLSPQEGAPPFVEIGTDVSEEDTVCIIEVMKLFSAISAGVRGRIAKICVENGEMVEHNQLLFLVEPEKD